MSANVQTCTDPLAWRRYFQPNITKPRLDNSRDSAVNIAQEHKEPDQNRHGVIKV